MENGKPVNQAATAAQAGFTLIEMMVVIVIIGILAAIAVPQYGQYVRTSQIQEAQAGMLQIRTRLENYYQDNRNYGTGGFCFGSSTAVIGNDPTVAQVGTIAQQLSNRYFVFACSTPTEQTYLITARGSAGRVTGDGQQATFTLTEQNIRRTTHWGPAAALTPACNRWLVSEALGACP